MNFKQKFLNFFRGIYGNDQLNIFLICLYFLTVVVNSFSGIWLLSIVEIALVFLIFFRMFSKNIYKRRNENTKFMNIFGKVKNRFKQAYTSIRFYNKFLYRTCPNCKARLRMTRKRGKHTVKCPLCNNEFQIKIL